MKPIQLFLIAMLSLPMTGMAQMEGDFDPMGNGPGMQRVQEFRRAYISEMMALSASDSTAFWKLHEEFESKKRGIRQEMRSLTKGVVAQSDAQLKEGIDQLFTLKQQEVDLEKEYAQKYLGMLSVRQVVALLQAEKEVKRELLKELKHMRGGGRKRGKY